MTLEEMEKRLKDVEKRLTATEDIEEIKRLHYRYMNAFMVAKWDEVLDCFTEDAALDVTPPDEPVRGKAVIEKIFKETIGKGHIGREGDFVLHPIISIDGNKAKGNWMMYMMYMYRRTGQPLFWVQGTYNAEYIKVDGEWKFSYLYHRPLMTPPGGPPPFEGI